MRAFIAGASLAALTTISITLIQPRAVAGKECPTPQIVDDAKYKPGQIWEYKTRPGEPASRITILRIESFSKLGVIVHVRIAGVHLKNCGDTIQHAPFAKAALDESVVRQSGSNSKIPAYEEGYKRWLSDCGGVYTIPAARVVDTIDSMLPQETCD